MFGTLAAWRAYAALRGNQAPTLATDAVATAALVRASDYIRTRYVLRFLDPLAGVAAVEEATYIAASLELTTPGFWTASYTPSEATVLTRVGPIAWTPIDGGRMGADGFLPTSPAIEALLNPFGVCGLPAVMVV